MGIIKDRYNEAKKERYRLLWGYKMDKWIFQAAMYCVFLYLFIVAASYDFSISPYFSCPMESSGIQGQSFGMSEGYEYEYVSGGCKNPYYKAESWRNQQYLLPGEYGDAPNNWLSFAWPITFLLFIIAGVANHYLHNAKDLVKEAEEKNENN